MTPTSVTARPATTHRTRLALPTRIQKAVAANLVEQLLTGDKKAEALDWLKRRRYSGWQLENFIAAMERGLALKKEQTNG